MGNYPVNLSIIGALQANSERFSAVMCENRKKTISLWLFGPEHILFLIKFSILLLAHLAQATGRLYCEFEWNRSNAIKIRQKKVN